ncbi:Centrosomal protein of 41 kDa [Blastocladiella emersonii ATCC 22665]|nr:Centrosomal protein of 41 kDa [Blastocladiella emersonii ATCC 22665]
MSKKSIISDRSFLGKKLPKSKRYTDIGPTIDTGSSSLSQLRKLKETAVDHKYLANELFIRLKPILFGRLIYETQMEHDLEAMEEAVSSRLLSPHASRAGTPVHHHHHAPTPVAAPSPWGDRGGESDVPSFGRRRQHPGRLHDSVMGLMADPEVTRTPVGDAEQSHTPGLRGLRMNGSADTGYNHQLPYLLLDVREYADWRKCHIVGALPYPAGFIKRDQLSRDLIMYRNKPEHIVILYDDDETIAVPAAQILAERGFDNVYVLSGGLHHAVEKLSGVFVGEPPEKRRAPAGAPAALPRLGRARGAVAQPAAPSPLPQLPPGPQSFNMHDLERALLNATPSTVAGGGAGNSRSSTRLSMRSDASSTVPVVRGAGAGARSVATPVSSAGSSRSASTSSLGSRASGSSGRGGGGESRTGFRGSGGSMYRPSKLAYSVE